MRKHNQNNIAIAISCKPVLFESRLFSLNIEGYYPNAFTRQILNRRRRPNTLVFDRYIIQAINKINLDIAREHSPAV